MSYMYCEEWEKTGWGLTFQKNQADALHNPTQDGIIHDQVYKTNFRSSHNFVQWIMTQKQAAT